MSEVRLEQLPDVLTVSETARFLRVGKGSIYEAIRRNEIPALKIGRRLLIPKVALTRLLAEGNSTTDEGG
jgi:excisionase family DNA binding protein